MLFLDHESDCCRSCIVYIICRAFSPWREKLDFFSPLGFEAKSDFDHKTSKLKQLSIRASQRYLTTKIRFMVEKQHRFFDLVQRTLNQTLEHLICNRGIASSSLSISKLFSVTYMECRPQCVHSRSNER